MKISLLQTRQNKLYDFGFENYIAPDERKRLAEEMVIRTAEMAECAARYKCDYIITTEAVNFSGVPLNEETFNAVEEFGGKSFELFSRVAKRFSVNICAGLYNMRSGKIYNSAVLFNRYGQIEYVYDKVNLAGDENKMITPGSEYMLIESEYGKIAPLICWDMQCGAAKAVAYMGADIIFCPTWGWENRYGLDCAVQNSIYIAAAMAIPYRGNITGVRTPSEIIDKNGRILAVASDSEECIITKEFDLI